MSGKGPVNDDCCEREAQRAAEDATRRSSEAMSERHLRAEFVSAFGEVQACAIEHAAEGHKNGIHDRPGSDPFRWALLICIGHECFTKASYRTYHDITAPAMTTTREEKALSDPYAELRILLARLKAEWSGRCGICDYALPLTHNGLCERCEDLASKILCGDTA